MYTTFAPDHNLLGPAIQFPVDSTVYYWDISLI